MFTLNRLGAVWSVVLIGAGLSVACGDSKSSMNPVAPSAVVIGAQAQEADDADGGESSTTGGSRNNNGNNGNGNNGNGNSGGGNGNNGNGGNGNGGNGNGGNGNNQPSVPGTSQPPANTTPSTVHKVEIEGLIASKNGSWITVNAQQISVPATCVIRHGNTQFTFSDLKVGDRVHVKAMRTTTGSGATATTAIEATEVKLQNPGGGEGNDDEGEDEEDSTDLVSVTATDDLASETGNPGTFRLSRAGAATLLASPLTVSFTLSGTATTGTDYTSVPLTATFPANQTTVDVVVTPTADTTTEGAETVILTLTGVTPYQVGSPASATVTITDTDSPLVTVTAFDAAASESGGDLGTFRFTRTGSTAAALTVTFTVSGTATAGTDYQALPATVTIPAGAATADVFVIALPDSTTEGSETVAVTVTDGAAYDVGSAASATVHIAG